MQSHVACLYNFLKRRNDNNIPPSFPCFICSLELPLVALSIHPPPNASGERKHDDDEDIDVEFETLKTQEEEEAEPRTFANFQPKSSHNNEMIENKNKNKNKLRDNKHILHPEFYQNHPPVPLQTSLTRFFASAKKLKN